MAGLMGAAIGSMVGDQIKSAADDTKRDQLTLYEMYDANRRENTRHSEWNTEMNFATDAYYNRYSNTVADLKRAGLNPMLAVGGQPPTAGGGPSTGGPGPSPSLSGAYKNNMSLAGSVSSAANVALMGSQVDLNAATARKVDADTRLAEQSANESRAREATEKERPEFVRQQVRQTSQSVETLAAQAVASYASAAQSGAFAAKARAEIEQVRATIQNLTAHTELYRSETDRVMVEKRIAEIQEFLKEMEKPGALNNAEIAQSYLGRVGAALKQIVPILR